MLNRGQLKLLLLAGKYGSDNNDFSQFPRDLIHEISSFYDPEADKLVQLVADGKKNEVKQMLDKNPRLVLQAAKEVVTPGGIKFKRIMMPYECAIACGDPDMALMVGEYFEKIQSNNNAINKEDFTNECKKLREEQFKRYEQAIDNMLQVKSYDFTNLINIIKQSSAQAVTEELAIGDAYDPTYKSDLRTALEAFRKVFAPCEPKTPEEQIEYIGFIYASLLQAFKLLNDEWDVLSNQGSDYDKNRLVWRQLIGFIERRLPTVDRQAFAQGVDTIKSLSEMVRTLTYKYDAQNEFPRTDMDISRAGLGFDIGISIFGCGGGGGSGRAVGRWDALLKSYVEQKHQDLKKLSSSCNIQVRNTK